MHQDITECVRLLKKSWNKVFCEMGYRQDIREFVTFLRVVFQRKKQTRVVVPYSHTVCGPWPSMGSTKDTWQETELFFYIIRIELFFNENCGSLNCQHFIKHSSGRDKSVRAKVLLWPVNLLESDRAALCHSACFCSGYFLSVHCSHFWHWEWQSAANAKWRSLHVWCCGECWTHNPLQEHLGPDQKIMPYLEQKTMSQDFVNLASAPISPAIIFAQKDKRRIFPRTNL